MLDTRSPVKRPQRQSWLAAAVLGVAWVGILFAGLLQLMLIDVVGGACVVSDGADQRYGETSWGFVPPGPVCSWTDAQGEVHRDGPGPTTSIWIVTLVGLGWVTLRVTPGAGRPPV